MYFAVAAHLAHARAAGRNGGDGERVERRFVFVVHDVGAHVDLGDEPPFAGPTLVPALDEPPVELAAPAPLFAVPSESLLHALTHTSRHVVAALPSTSDNERD